MLDKINEINLNETISQDILYPLLEPKNPLFKLEILSKLQNFKTNDDFFSHYTHFNMTLLKDILKESKNKINFFIESTKNIVFEENEIENYLSIVSNIIITNFFINQLESYINNIYTQLNDYIISILKTQKNEELHYKLNEYLQLIDQSSNNYQRRNIITFSRISTKENTYINKVEETPRFFELNDKLNISLNYENDLNSFYNSPLKKLSSPRMSICSLASMVFSPPKENDSHFITPKKNITFSNLNFKVNKEKSENLFTQEKCVKIFGICKEMFKKKLINSNEKLKFKKLIIGKDENILKIVDNDFSKEKLFSKIKNYLDEQN
jgi:hypothetical protein